jgi:pSer/pThr/pTyr-binding forkhead associated (FHA) protein
MSTAFLTIINGAPVKKYRLNAHSITIGNGPGNSINLPVQSINQTHCRIKYEGDNYILEDIYNCGNLYINGVKISSQSLISEDMIQIGEVVLKFEIGEVPSVTKSAPATKTSTLIRKPQSNSSVQTAPKSKIGQPPSAKSNMSKPGFASRRQTSVVTKNYNKKQKGIFAILIVVVGAIIIFFVGIKGKSGLSQEELTKELQQIVKNVDSLVKEKKVIEADELLEKTIGDPKYANTKVLPQIKQIHNSVHDSAEQEKKALAEVTQFSEKLDKAMQNNEMKYQADQLFDECQSLIGKYSFSAQGAKLQQFKEDLAKVIGKQKQLNWIDEFDKMKKDAAQLLDNNSYSEAITLLDNFKNKYGNDAILASEIKNELDTINRKAKTEFNQIKEKITRLKGEGKSADSAKLLNEAMGRFMGTACYKDLEGLK